MRFFTFSAALLLLSSQAIAQTDNAASFGLRESGEMSLSPDGTQIANIQPTKGAGSALHIAAVDNGSFKAVLNSDGLENQLDWCEWSSNTRLVCSLSATRSDGDLLIGFNRLIAVNSDGTAIKHLGQRRSDRTIGLRQFDGRIIGWSVTGHGEVLMARSYIEEGSTGTRLANTSEGLGVDSIDTETLKSRKIETPRNGASDYIADAEGNVRIMSMVDVDGNGDLRGITRHLYRTPSDKVWRFFSEVRVGKDGFEPVSVDLKQNVAYAFGKHNGRSALFKVALDGTLASSLLLSNDKVDIGSTVTLGRKGRVIGAQFVTDKRQTILFDPEYLTLQKRLSKAIPGLPLIEFVGASQDENRLLLFAGSDQDPGRYFIFDKRAKTLNEISLARPSLEKTRLSKVTPVQYPAADGTMIPGYLTLPVDSDGRNIQAIVMPHGGPASRDEWGFDWWAQFYAAQGFAVLQPNFRGSSGYGDGWYVENGFKSWRTAIGDVNDAGRWLIKQGIANPSKLAIVGWSYGGYAALQSPALDPNLFKAIVAVAPVTDLRMMIDESEGFTNSVLVARFVGSGEHITSGSPLKQVSGITAPVLMFSGDRDSNVGVAQSRAMNAALIKAGKDSRLVIYKGLNHQLPDSNSRADMLRQSDAFLKKALGLVQ